MGTLSTKKCEMDFIHFSIYPFKYLVELFAYQFIIELEVYLYDTLCHQGLIILLKTDKLLASIGIRLTDENPGLLPP